MDGRVIWLTGLSASGKTTLGLALSARLRALGQPVEFLDGDHFRRGPNRDLGYSPQDRAENVRRIGDTARGVALRGRIAIVSAISPFRDGRDALRARLQNFTEIFVNAPLEVCELRDPARIYERFRTGEIRNVPGLDQPYEPPFHPEVVCETWRESVEESLSKILDHVIPLLRTVEAAPRLPDFFVVGAPKAGSTALYNYLDQHPEIFMSPVKEPHYFADEVRIENFSEEMRRLVRPRIQPTREYLRGSMSVRFSAAPISEWDDYLRLFRHANSHAAVGEASVCYLWSKTAAQNIARHLPHSRIVMVLRDPAERAFSQHVHALSVSSRKITFDAHIDRSLKSTSDRFSPLYPFLGFGLYYQQVKRYFDLFPRDRIRVYLYEDFVQDAVGLCQDLFRFLSVDPRFAPDVTERHMVAQVPRFLTATRWLRRFGLWEQARAWIPPAFNATVRRAAFRPKGELRLQPADRARLVEFYSDDVRKLSTLLDRDLSHWRAVSPH